MTAAFRLREPLDPDAPVGRRVHFTWEGRQVEGRENEPLAVSLLAAGHDTLSRSYRFHRPRGLMCATGSCGWCDCQVEGRTGVRSCLVPVRGEMVARGEHAWPSVERDLLSVLDRANRLVTPSFYHHRFLRPRALRKRYLDVIRSFGGRGKVMPGPRVLEARQDSSVEADVLVIGAGLAGLTAARAALDAGATVAVVDARPKPGGHRSWSEVSDERATVRELASEVASRATVILGARAITREGDRTVVLVPGGTTFVRSRVVVAATGSYEKPPFVPGSDRPGVISSRMLEALLVQWGVAPGRQSVIIGGGAEAERASRLLRLVDVGIRAVVAPTDVRAIVGRRRVEGVAFVGPTGTPCSVRADHVVFTARVPNLDLARLAGATLTSHGGTLAPRVGSFGQTSVPWLLCAGSASGATVGDLAGLCIAQASGAGAARLAGDPTSLSEPTTIESERIVDGMFEHAVAPSSHVCFCEDVRVRDLLNEASDGYRDPELLKRRTGTLTGYCQGKLCLDRFLGVCEQVSVPRGRLVIPPTARPPLSPVRLSDLVAPRSEDRWTD